MRTCLNHIAQLKLIVCCHSIGVQCECICFSFLCTDRCSMPTNTVTQELHRFLMVLDSDSQHVVSICQKKSCERRYNVRIYWLAPRDSLSFSRCTYIDIHCKWIDINSNRVQIHWWYLSPIGGLHKHLTLSVLFFFISVRSVLLFGGHQVELMFWKYCWCRILLFLLLFKRIFFPFQCALVKNLLFIDSANKNNAILFEKKNRQQPN